MYTYARAVGLTVCLVVASSLHAQRPGGPRGPGGRPAFEMMAGVPGRGAPGPIAATADFLLAHTGALSLTDAQVVRLAAISRRTDARRKSLVARMDSARAAARAEPRDSAAPPARGGRPAAPPAAELHEARDQMHADVCDAIAVLTPDQQATAWMLVAGGPALGAVPGRPAGSRQGRGVREGPPDRGSISRPPAPRDVPRRPDGVERTEP